MNRPGDIHIFHGDQGIRIIRILIKYLDKAEFLRNATKWLILDHEGCLATKVILDNMDTYMHRVSIIRRECGTSDTDCRST